MDTVLERIKGKTQISNQLESTGIQGPAKLRISTVNFTKSYIGNLCGVGEVQLNYCYLPSSLSSLRATNYFQADYSNIADRL